MTHPGLPPQLPVRTPWWLKIAVILTTTALSVTIGIFLPLGLASLYQTARTDPTAAAAFGFSWFITLPLALLAGPLLGIACLARWSPLGRTSLAKQLGKLTVITSAVFLVTGAAMLVLSRLPGGESLGSLAALGWLALLLLAAIASTVAILLAVLSVIRKEAGSARILCWPMAAAVSTCILTLPALFL